MPIARSDWPRLLNLLEQALDLPESERDAWLHGLDLSALEHSALRGLLDERRAIETEDFLAALPVLPVDDMASASGRLMPGALIGPWRLLREIGQGGMSTVWLAERADEQVTRRVALKLPHAGPGQDLLARRLLRERNILASLEHPNIARLYDVGLTDAGTPYLVMEYVPGDTLLAHSDHHKLGIPQRLALFQQVLRAVQYAHGKLVLHRDLKPSNILVSEAGDVKLLDFGIAKMLGFEGGTHDETELTSSSGRQLTPRYASPEQLRGQPLGTTSDIYSLGVVLYELLCGQRPHDAKDAWPGQFEDAVLNREPIPPSRSHPDDAALEARGLAQARALRKMLAGDLDAIVLKALAKAPEHRYPTADALAADLVHWTRGEPITARLPRARYLAAKFVVRHRVGVALSGAVVAVLLGTAAVAVWQGQTARQEADRAATARDFLLELFAEAAPDRLRGEELSAMQLLERGRQRAQEQLGGQAQLQAELLAGIGETQHQVRDMTAADEALAKAANYFMATGDSAREASARMLRLQIALEEDNFDTVDGLLRDLAPLASTIKNDPLLSLRWLNAQGHYANFSGNPDEARKWLGQAIESAHPSDPTQAAIVFDSHIELAFAGMHMVNVSLVNEQLALAERIPTNGNTLSAAEKAFRLADARAKLNDLLDLQVENLRTLPQAIAACGSAFGEASPKCGLLKVSLIRSLIIAGYIEQSRAMLPELNRWLRQSTSPGARFKIALLGSRILALDGQTDRGLEPIAVLEALVQPDATKAVSVARQMPAFMTLAEIRLRAGERQQASAWWTRAEQSMDQAGGERDAALSHLKMGQALALQSEGRDLEALALMEGLCERPAEYSVRVLFSLNCVRSLIATGKSGQAVKLMRGALPILERALGPTAPNTVRVRRLLDALESPRGYRLSAWTPSDIFLAF